MDSVLNIAAVTFIIFIITSEVGWLLGRSGVPYGAGKLVTHIILFLLIMAAAISSGFKLHEALQDKLYSLISLSVTVLTLLINFATGVKLIFNPANPKLVSLHRYSKTVMAISIISSIIFLTVKM